MRKFNPFRSKKHRESSDRSKTTTALPGFISYSNINIDHTTPTQPINISAPIINCTDKVVINGKYQLNENSNEEQTAIIENDNVEEQIVISEQREKMSDESNYTYDQFASSISTSSNQSSSSIKQIESSSSSSSPPTITMVGNSPKEDILTSCKATAMIYNDTQKKWIHCAPNGPAKIQLLFAPETQTYRIVGRQIQSHEVVLNHSIIKGIKYNQATPTFHQWRDQSCVYGLNFPSKIDAQEFGTTMMKILESVNGSPNVSSQTNINPLATLPSMIQNNNNNTSNNSATSNIRQINQSSSSSLPSTATTVSIHSTSNSSSVSEIKQQQQQQPQQQQYSSPSYNNPLRPNSTSINSISTSTTSNNYYSQNPQLAEDDDTNYALISDSYSSYVDNSINKTNNIPPAPPLNPSMSTTGSAPPAAPPPPPPPPPPPMPSGLGSGPPPAPGLVLPNANGNGNANPVRKVSTTAAPLDLMSEMAAKFAQRRKVIDEGEKSDSSNTVSTKASPKVTTSTLPAATPAPVQTSPRVARKTIESSSTNITSNDLEKIKNEILTEIRKDIEKAKQEILTAILDQQKRVKK